MSDANTNELRQSSVAEQSVERADNQKDRQERRNEYNGASALGRNVIDITTERRMQGYNFTLNQEKFPGGFVQAIADKAKDEEITAIQVAEAKRASFGLSLEAARQLQRREEVRTGAGAVHEDIDSLVSLQTILSDGAKLAEELRATDRDGYLSTARQLVASELDNTPDEVKIAPAELDAWVQENYRGATSRLDAKIEALRDLLQTTF